MLRKNKEAIGWTLTDLKGLDPSLCTHRIFLEDESRPVKEAQRRLNSRVWEAVKEEILKWLNAEIIYPISDSQWVSPVHVVPKKAGVTVMMNEKGEEIQTCLLTKWRVYIDYQKLNSATKKEHFPLPFIDQILDRLVGSNYFCFLDGYSGYNHIAIHPDDQEKTTFTCPFGTFAFKRMSFILCNAPLTFQRCMTAIFSDFLGDSLEVFMDDFSVFGNDFESCLAHLTKILEVDGSFLCIVKTQKRWSNKIYKTALTKIRYNNQVLCKYQVDPQRPGLTLIAELTWSNLGLKRVLNKRK